jgi:hypothetical protein
MAWGRNKRDGGGDVRIHHQWAAGPLNLLRAARLLPEHEDQMVSSYGNIGCGGSWLQIGDVRIDSMDLPATMAGARTLLERMQSGAYVAERAELQRILDAEMAGTYGNPLRDGATHAEREAYAYGKTLA